MLRWCRIGGWGRCQAAKLSIARKRRFFQWWGGENGPVLCWWSMVHGPFMVLLRCFGLLSSNCRPQNLRFIVLFRNRINTVSRCTFPINFWTHPKYPKVLFASLDLTPDQHHHHFFFRIHHWSGSFHGGYHGVSHLFVGAQGELVLLLLVDLPSIAGHGFLSW